MKWELNPQNPFNPLFENMFNSSNYLSLEHKEKFKESLIYYFNSFEFDLKRFGIRETFDSKTINNYYSNTGNGLGGLLGNIFESSEKDIEFSTLISKYFEISKGLLSTKEDTKKGFVNLSKERLQKLNITSEDLLHPSVEVTQKLLEQSKIEIQKISKLEKIANNPFQKIVANWCLRY